MTETASVSFLQRFGKLGAFCLCLFGVLWLIIDTRSQLAQLIRSSASDIRTATMQSDANFATINASLAAQSDSMQQAVTAIAAFAGLIAEADEVATKLTATQALMEPLSLELKEANAASARLATEVREGQKVFQVEIESAHAAMNGELTQTREVVKQTWDLIAVEEASVEVAEAVAHALNLWLPDDLADAKVGSSVELSKDINELHALMQLGIAPQFSGQMKRLDWWLAVRELQETSADSLARIPSLLARASKLVNDAPTKAPSWAIERLTAYRKDLAYRAAALAAADAIATGADVEVADALVEQAQGMWAGDSAEFKGLAAKRKDLATKWPGAAAGASVGEQLAALRIERTRVKAITDSEIRLALLGATDAQATALLLTDLNSQDRPAVETEVRAMVRETAALRLSETNRQSLKYQAWALGLIEAAEAKINKSFLGPNDPSSKFREHLLPLIQIDQGSLEPALSKKYSEVWALGWEPVGEDDRRSLLSQIANTAKKHIGEIP